jgi:hypothetical protein
MYLMPLSENPALDVSPSTGRDRFVSPAALYDDWLVAETEATLALAAWFAARPGAKADTHALYAAAVAREALAADLLAARLGAQ